MTNSQLVSPQDVATARENCERFAREHGLRFEPHGEVGFGRPCVGFLRGNAYVAIHPYSAATYEEIWPRDQRLDAPEGVKAYHKHDCLSVLVDGENYGAGIQQLDMWIRTLEAVGPVEVATYETGAVGVQAIFSGVTGYALRFKQ
jgi:hypothetical protein